MAEDTTIVTGLPGWLGNRFVDALLNGLPEVAALAQPRQRNLRVLSTDSEHPFMKELGRKDNVGIVNGDLRNISDVQKLFDGANGGTVFHIAGVIHPSSAKDFFSINYEGTKNMLEQAVKSGVRRFIYVSSNSPLGVNASNDGLFDESAPYNPYMNYGKSKMMAEQLVTSADQNLETVIIRPPWFYGPGQPPRQSLFFTMIKNGKAPIVGDGKNLRSMAYVDNISQGLLLAEKVDKANKQIYWIADARPYSMNEIVDTIEKLLEKDFSMKVAHKRMRLPGIASEVALAVDASLQSLGLYQQKIHVLSEMNKTIACSIQKARTELGYDPKVALEEGMAPQYRLGIERRHHNLNRGFMPGVPKLTSRNLLIAQSILAALFFLIGLASEQLVSISFLIRQLVPFLTNTTAGVYLAYYCWLTAASIAFVFWGRLKVAPGRALQSKWFDCLFLQLLISLILLTRCLQFPIAYDDSYIDYRYVHNLVWHHSFDYNPGWHVMGFTSHLHLLVLAALSVLSHNDDIAFISQQLNALCQCASVLLLYGFIKKHLSTACAALAGLLFAFDAFMITECAYGKETSIVVMLILVALIAHEKKSQTLYAWANALLFLARPEGIVWLGAALCTQMWEKRRLSALKPWIIPLSVVACWVVFLLLYFGTIIPHGALAKARIYPRRPVVATAVEVGTVVSNFIAPLSLKNGGHPLREYAAIKALHSSEAYLFVVIAGLVVICALVWMGFRYRWLRVYSWGATCLAGFFVVTNPPMFSWYYCWFALMPVLMGPCLVSIVARRLTSDASPGRALIARIAGGRNAASGRSSFSTYLSGAIPLALTAYLVVIPICQAPYEVPSIPFPLFVWEDHQQRLLSLLEATIWVKSNYGNKRLLAVLEPGIIGYYYEGPVLDLDGLVSDEMLKYYPLKPGLLPSGVAINIPVPAIHDLSPAWLIFFDRIGFNLVRDPEFQSRYVQRKNYPEHFGVMRSTCVFQLKQP